MAYLSAPIGDLRPEYDVVVVGSGYGGAIAALRMLEKWPPSSVCVLERGPERQAGEFPSTIRAALGQSQVDTRMGRVGRRTALFDMRVNKDVSVLVGCGLGGTSLINAGVMLEPLPDVFAADRWPGRPDAPTSACCDRIRQSQDRRLKAAPGPARCRACRRWSSSSRPGD